ncbi:pirin family protein [Paenibacillus solanacearum]|nr:pirin family protein [Paenibacillus solanacearum]
MTIRNYSPAEQAVGAFDGGTITEQKPIGFPGEGSAVRRVGPLFYWAWFQSEQGGRLPLHPHRGFEILTYVLHGEVNHRDSLGRASLVGTGGAQVMQTGRGVSHAEEFRAGVSGFQIWFEPYYGDAVKRVPTYTQYEHEQFPASLDADGSVKTVIGPGAPIDLVADVRMWDVALEAGRGRAFDIPAGYSMAGLVVEGESAHWSFGGENANVPLKHFAVADAADDSRLLIQAGGEQAARIILIQVPTELGYLPYNKIPLT